MKTTEEIRGILFAKGSNPIEVIENPEKFGLTVSDLVQYGIHCQELKPGMRVYYREM